MAEFIVTKLKSDDLQILNEFEKFKVFDTNFVAFKVNDDIVIHEDEFVSIYKPNSKPKLLMRKEYYISALLKTIEKPDIVLHHGFTLIKRLGANSPFKQGLYEILLINNSHLLYSKLITKNFSIVEKDAFEQFKQTFNLTELDYDKFVGIYKQAKELNIKDHIIEMHSENIETYVLKILSDREEKAKQKTKLDDKKKEVVTINSNNNTDDVDL
jgi:hypothetical protein